MIHATRVAKQKITEMELVLNAVDLSLLPSVSVTNQSTAIAHALIVKVMMSVTVVRTTERCMCLMKSATTINSLSDHNNQPQVNRKHITTSRVPLNIKKASQLINL